MAVTFTDRQLFKRAVSGLVLAMGVGDNIGIAAQASSEYFVFSKAADDATAATATAETGVPIYFKRACIVKSIAYTPQTGSLIGDPTNNASVTVTKRDATGANPLTVGTLLTTTALVGTVNQYASTLFALTPANVAVAAGSSLTTTVVKNGTGVILRAGLFTVEVEWD